MITICIVVQGLLLSSIIISCCQSFIFTFITCKDTYVDCRWFSTFAIRIRIDFKIDLKGVLATFKEFELNFGTFRYFLFKRETNSPKFITKMVSIFYIMSPRSLVIITRKRALTKIYLSCSCFIY